MGTPDAGGPRHKHPRARRSRGEWSSAGSSGIDRRRPHVLVTALALLDELTRVLAYPRLCAVHGLNDAEIMQYVQSVEAASLVVPLTAPSVTAVQSDPDDNAVIATAIAGQADAICTRDRHFHQQDVVDFCAQHGIRILDDVELLRELRAAGGPGPQPPQP